ncbi:MAG: hypothetical protein ACREQO_24390 [Candidatus Binatia bacterium]
MMGGRAVILFSDLPVQRVEGQTLQNVAILDTAAAQKIDWR